MTTSVHGIDTEQFTPPPDDVGTASTHDADAAVAAAADTSRLLTIDSPPPSSPDQVALTESKRERSTDDTSLDGISSNLTTGTSVGPYEIIEYDLGDHDTAAAGIPIEMLNELLMIDDDSPAAAALRANAGVHVSTVGKAARAVHIQTVRKLVKRATLTTKSGFVRGKPPRIPPQLQPSNEEGGEGESTTHAVEVEHPSLPHVHQGEAIPEDEMAVINDNVVPGTVEAGKKVLGSVDPHGLLKLLRWRRKKVDSVRKPKSYVKGKVIDGEHELYTLSIAVMIGVRTSISKTNVLLNEGTQRRWVQPKDFRTTEKYEFRPKGGAMTPPHQLAHTFKFKDYCPVVFAYLRRMYGVNEFDFLLSVCGNANFIEFVSNAKSGQFFFYSNDGRYMIKTMTNAESKFLRRMLPHYFHHCAQNPNTMITRFFGMYRVKLYHLRRNVKFVIMNSVYYTDKYLQTFYDLKGSTIGRDAKPGDAVMKDNDLRGGLPQEALAMRPDVQTAVRRQIAKDCDFLTDISVMDYSMLVGVHHIPSKVDQSIATIGFCSKQGHRRKMSEDNPANGGGSVSEQDVNRTRWTEDEATKRQTKSEPAHINGNLHHHLHHHQHPVNDTFFEDDLMDDDSSYLFGSSNRANDNSSGHFSFNEETERKKQATIEKLYWPFHRLFDIHGYRRLEPAICPTCTHAPCTCNAEEDKTILAGYNLPLFVKPLSERKDGGFEMDTTGLKLPMEYRGRNGDVKKYDGKIFYMGIIDVLQEFTSRKVLETQYRILQTGGWNASCVPPGQYASRFVNFFDEYTRIVGTEEQGIEVELDAPTGPEA